MSAVPPSEAPEPLDSLLPWPVVTWGSAAILALMALPHLLPIFYVFLATETLILALFGLSLNLLMGYTGMVCFGHAAFLGFGGYSATFLALASGAPMAVAFLGGPIAAAVAAMLFGGLAVRLSATYFAMLTLAFQMILYTVAFKWRDVTGGEDGLRGVRPPGILQGPVPYYCFTVAVVLACMIVMYVIVKSPLGYTLRAIRENSVRTQHMGINVRLHQWIAFVVAAFFAGVAGALLAYSKGGMFPEYLHWTNGADPILVSVLGGMHAYLGPVVGAVFYRSMVYVVGRYTEYWPLVEGSILLLVAVTMPKGIVGFAESLRQRRAPTIAVSTPASATPDVHSTRSLEIDPARLREGGGDILQIRDLHKRFGGVRAVDGASITVREGALHAVIGPNGAGKSTLFNMLTGLLRPDAGQILFSGHDISRLPPHTIIGTGISRTFQITSILRGLSVYENVLVALLAQRRRTLDIVTPALRVGKDDVRRLLEAVGLGVHARRISAFLSHGDQKRLELAIALANRPRLLLLDEPTAGMAPSERIESVGLVKRIAQREGLTVLFTEHDMDVVFGTADFITVMHQGRVLAEGTPETIRADERVQQVYLGRST